MRRNRIQANGMPGKADLLIPREGEKQCEESFG
jgi:hypothetical protein